MIVSKSFHKDKQIFTQICLKNGNVNILTKIYIIFIGLILIISSAPDIASNDFEKDSKKMDFAHVPIEEIAVEFRKIRKIKGHFNGGKWNDEVDKWMGRKHRLMIELGLRISGDKYKKGDIIRLLDQPDHIVHKGDDLFKLIISQKKYDSSPQEYDSSTTTLYEFLIYYWRGKHDFLFFTCRNSVIIQSGWWYAGE